MNSFAKSVYTDDSDSYFDRIVSGVKGVMLKF